MKTTFCESRPSLVLTLRNKHTKLQQQQVKENSYSNLIPSDENKNNADLYDKLNTQDYLKEQNNFTQMLLLLEQDYLHSMNIFNYKMDIIKGVCNDRIRLINTFKQELIEKQTNILQQLILLKQNIN